MQFCSYDGYRHNIGPFDHVPALPANSRPVYHISPFHHCGVPSIMCKIEPARCAKENSRLDLYWTRSPTSSSSTPACVHYSKIPFDCRIIIWKYNSHGFGGSRDSCRAAYHCCRSVSCKTPLISYQHLFKIVISPQV